MTATGAQPPLWLALLAIALLALVWQLYRAVRLRRGTLSFPHAAFWVGVAAWVSLGLYAQAPGLCPEPAVLWRWILPAAGLLVTALLRWTAGVLPHLTLEGDVAPEPVSAPGEAAPSNGRHEEVDLDAEDLQLLGRMRLLLSKRAADLMVPVDAAPTVRADADGRETLEALTRSRARRVAVLAAAGPRSQGVIDGLALALALIDHERDAAGHPGPSSPAPRAGRFCRPIPAVPAWRPAHEALEILRSGGQGMAAVVDGRNRVQGLLAWPPLFRALLGRTAHGGRL